MEVLIFAILLGLIPAMIAKSKGLSFGLWWFYGAMLFIIALPHSLIMSTDKKSVEAKRLSEGMKKEYLFVMVMVFLPHTAFADLCPDGSYVSGGCTLAPNDSYVGGSRCTLMPDGSYR